MFYFNGFQIVIKSTHVEARDANVSLKFDTLEQALETLGS